MATPCGDGYMKTEQRYSRMAALKTGGTQQQVTRGYTGSCHMQEGVGSIIPPVVEAAGVSGGSTALVTPRSQPRERDHRLGTSRTGTK